MVSKNIAFCLVEASAERFFGLTAGDRFRKCLSRLGITTEINLGEAASWPKALLILRADYVLDEVLVAGLAARPAFALLSQEAPRRVVAAHSADTKDREQALALIVGTDPPITSDIYVGTVTDLVDNGTGEALRKRYNPLILNIKVKSSEDIEERLFAASYKGVTDFVTKYVWPWPALRVTRWCARAGLTPNQVTAVSAFCVLAAFILFWHGYLVSGVLVAWAMCFLDTVDGKLARVTLSSSKWGNVFDHGIDLIHPPFWYWAWFVGLNQAGIASSAGLDMSLWIIVVGYILGRLQEGWFLWRFKFEIHAWRRIDSLFRQVTARRNPNLAILTVAAIFGEPDKGFQIVAIWTVASLMFHFLRIAHSEIEAARGRSPRSWLTLPEKAPI